MPQKVCHYVSGQHWGLLFTWAMAHFCFFLLDSAYSLTLSWCWYQQDLTLLLGTLR